MLRMMTALSAMAVVMGAPAGAEMTGAMPFSGMVGLPPALVSPDGLPPEIAAQRPPVPISAPVTLYVRRPSVPAPAPQPDAEAPSAQPAQAAVAPPPEPEMSAPPEPDMSGASEPEMSEAARACDAALGAPDATAPVSAEAAAQRQDALARVSAACLAAAAEPDPAPQILFHAAMAQEAEGRLDAAHALLERAAAEDLAAAQTRLGDYHLFGAGALSRDAQAAIPFYERAAQGGDPAAQLTLGILHRVGQGVEKDPHRMMFLISESAASGYHLAQLRMGQIYMTGEGISRADQQAFGIPDPERAQGYLARAAEAGNGEALLALGELTAPGAPGDDPVAHLRWVAAAAAQDVPGAHARLGLIYEEGRGVPADPDRAASAYIAALEAGLPFNDLRVGAVGWGWDPATARAFQSILTARGQYQGAIDGQIGPMSRRAAEALRP